ncbi:MAG: penicillin acylase family protein [Acidobacteriota bacterium]
MQQLRSSLPIVEGETRVAGLAAEVVVERDELGIPTIRGETRQDVSFALGFLHGQERFFQMDTTRRRAAGELAELVGGFALRFDRAIRPHRLRHTAEQALEALDPGERELLKAYTRGVNAGLSALEARPFEYLALRQEPRPWQEQDSLLVILAMFTQLQDENGRLELALGLLRDTLPEPLFRFLTPQGTNWDAPLIGEPLPAPPLPGPDVIDLRAAAEPSQTADLEEHEASSEWELRLQGSNAWALEDSLTAGQGALVANDMHLGFSVPNIWYRASFVWPQSGETRRVIGATLPGVPLMVIGSNERVAWGFTNSYIDSSDIILLELDESESRYRTPDGWRDLEVISEALGVRGGAAENLEVKWTHWGPVIGRDHQDRPYAVRWTGQLPEAIDLGFIAIETAGDVDEALDIAAGSGIPALGLTVGDRQGRVGWTLTGNLPRREGFDSRLPDSRDTAEEGWTGWLSLEDVPRVVDPEQDRVWAANNRVLSGPDLAKVGDGGYILGARAAQIRDALLEMSQADVEDMLHLQLDDRARYLDRWRELLQPLLDSRVDEADPLGALVRDQVAAWNGRAEVESVAYPIVADFRDAVFKRAFEPLIAPVLELDPTFRFTPGLAGRQAEGSLWTLLTERPMHLLGKEYDSWDALLEAALSDVLDEIAAQEAPLEQQTWGKSNTVQFRHPLSYGIPLVGRWIDYPATPLPGGYNMPRFQSRFEGASQRMAVIPGREEEGYFHMPGGQSGHPLSPNYRNGHQAWIEGTPSPFLPGPPVATLKLRPAESTSGSS